MSPIPWPPGRRAVVAAAGAAVAAATWSAPAGASVGLGALDVTPAAGNADSVLTLLTSGSCPAPATNLIVRVFGAGFPGDGEVVVGNSPLSIYPVRGAGMEVPISETLRDHANRQPRPATLRGPYDVVLTCRSATRLTTYGDYRGSMTFRPDGTFQAPQPAVPAAPAGVPAPAAPSAPARVPASVATPGHAAPPGAAAGSVSPVVPAAGAAPPGAGQGSPQPPASDLAVARPAAVGGSSSPTSGSSAPRWLWAVPLAALVGAGGALLAVRRNRPRPTAP